MPTQEKAITINQTAVATLPERPKTKEKTTARAKTKTNNQVIYRTPFWASLSVALSGFLLLGISIAYWKPELFGFRPASTATQTAESVSAPDETTDQLPYEAWLDILAKEAKAIAATNPGRLTVLLGDSLTLWFPPESLSGDRQWLNQGISGENTAGLLNRLNLLESLQPQTIFVMIGVNDLIKGSDDTELLERYQKLLEDLKTQQPNAEIVVQSILPHGGDRLTVIDRTQVLQVSNERIVQLNRKLETLSKQQGVLFLNLAPIFTDRDGLLRVELSTDGLHLNPQGYAVWQAAMQTFDQLELKPADIPADQPNSESQEDLPGTDSDMPAQ